MGWDLRRKRTKGWLSWGSWSSALSLRGTYSGCLEESREQGSGSTSPECSPAPSSLRLRCLAPGMVSLSLMSLIECSAIAQHRMRERGEKNAPFGSKLPTGQVNGRRQEQREHLPSITQCAASWTFADTPMLKTCMLWLSPRAGGFMECRGLPEC